MQNLKFMHFYHSYLDAIEPLSDVERGRLFTACLQYSKMGVASGLTGNERFIFPMIRAQIDRDKAAYIEKCQQNSRNRNERKRAVSNVDERLRTSTNVNECQRTISNVYEINQGEGEGEGEGKGKKTSPPFIPPQGGAQPEVAPAVPVPQCSDKVTKGSKTTRKPSVRVAYSEPFLRFWEAYPRQVDKQRAFEVWQRIPAVEHERVIAAARNYAAEMRRQEKEAEYIRHPKTFLDKGGWEDWVNGPPGQLLSPPEPVPRTYAEAKALEERQKLRDPPGPRTYAEAKALEGQQKGKMLGGKMP